MIRRVAVLLWALIVWLVSFLAVQSTAAVFNGQVVDSDTGEPLEGAVVVVVWYRYPVVYLMDPVPVFHQAVEAVTDAKGKFSLDTSYRSFPFRFDSRKTVLFKPGYRPMLGHLTDSENPRPIFSDQVLKLVKITAIQEMTKFTLAGDLGISTCYPQSSSYCVPEDRIRHLLHVLRLQRRILGLEFEGNVIR